MSFSSSESEKTTEKTTNTDARTFNLERTDGPAVVSEKGNVSIEQVDGGLVEGAKKLATQAGENTSKALALTGKTAENALDFGLGVQRSANQVQRDALEAVEKTANESRADALEFGNTISRSDDTQTTKTLIKAGAVATVVLGGLALFSGGK